MQEEKKYVFYVLSSSESPERFRYLGVSCRKLNARLSQHKYVARHPEKRSTPVAKWIYSLFQKDLDVIMTQIDSCGENEWENKEIELIQKYIDNGYNLLNVDKGGKGSITIENRPIEGRLRSAVAHEIRIVQLDLNGNYMKTFKSTQEATKEMGLLSKSAINNVLKGRSKTSCDSYWFYESDYLSGNFKINKRIDIKEFHGITHYQYCPDTFKLINRFKSTYDVFYEITGSKKSNSGGLKKAITTKCIWHNFFWSYDEIFDFSEYLDDRYKIHEVDFSNNIIRKFKNTKEAAEFFKIKEGSISTKITNRYTTKFGTYLIKNKRIKI